MFPRLEIDHLAVVAPSLEAGLAHVRRCLGVAPPAGGKHPLMGTHNHLARLGSDSYLEVIAPDPDAPPPVQARWFGLDRLAAGDPARLGTWIARTRGLDALLGRLPPILGSAQTMTRDALSWRISVRDDGGMPFEGAFPTLIEWPEGTWPGGTMADCGLGLLQLEITHPRADEIEAHLRPLIDDGRIVFRTGARAGLRAEISTAHGSRWLT